MSAITPIENALYALINNSEMLVDDDGEYVYKAFDGELESFEAGLFVYSYVIENAAKRIGVDINLNALNSLREEMLAKDGFDEDIMLSACDCLEKCKWVINKSPPKLIRELTLSCRSEFEKR
jgi:hypothetical protein